MSEQPNPYPKARRPQVDIVVLQHLNDDGPGYLGEWLVGQGVSWAVVCAEAGEAYPESVGGCRGLAVLGGAWSANDDRPSLRHAEALIREADAAGIPVIGHCLGGQLLAKALGGRVERMAVPEIGWHAITHTNSAAARAWLGNAPDATVYQWHQDSFVDLPPGAETLASSPACAHQAFAIRQHLGMQFHVEITPAKIGAWLAEAGDSLEALAERHPDSVQSIAAMHAATQRCQAGSEALARRIYGAWRERWRS